MADEVVRIKPIEVVDFLNQSYVDGETRELLFGAQEVSSRSLRGAQPLLRIIYSGALFCYLYWRDNKDKIKENQKSEGYLKVNEMCESLFKENELNLNSSIYLLFLIRKDVSANPKSSFFASCMDVSEPCEFGKIYGLLDEWGSSKERILTYYNNFHIFYFLMMATKCLRIVREADITMVGNEVDFIFDKQQYFCNEFLKFDTNYQYFYILLKEKDKYFDLKNLVDL